MESSSGVTQMSDVVESCSGVMSVESCRWSHVVMESGSGVK